MADIKWQWLKPGNYGHGFSCDSRRCEFDYKNEHILFDGRPVDLLFTGDSIIHFMEENQYYHKYGFVVNRGIGGDSIRGMKFRFMADVIQLKPRLCVMLIGTNDLWGEDADIDFENCCVKPEAEKRLSDPVLAGWREMLEMAKIAGVKVWVCSLLPQREGIINSKQRAGMLMHINSELRKLAEEYGTEYVDFYSNYVLEDGRTPKPESMMDFVHPNHYGYELMRQVLEPMLDKFFAKDK